VSQPYTIVIGLETHVQLATQSKLFCHCSTRFGAEPNTQTCPVCIGLPGSLPVMNRKALQLALRTALAINCQIPEFTKWDRKQYYYPDLPKGYQISQFDLPMSHDGYVEIVDPQNRFEPKRVGIIRAHLEEDAGKSLHDEVAGRADSVIDLNRTGTPLLEIVTEPDMRSPLEARAYLDELKLLLTYIAVSDCNMQEGSLRVDANINLHIDVDGSTIATPIVEIKNMNSFRAVERALEYEAERQYREWQETGRRLGEVPKQTRGWDDAAGRTKAQRSKEESSDYRYFPDPDLVPVVFAPDEIAAARQQLGELPQALRQRLQTDWGLTHYDADVLVNQGRETVDYFLQVAHESGDAKSAANWMTQDILRHLKQTGETLAELTLAPDTLAELIKRVATGDVPSARSREVFQTLVTGGGTVADAMQQLGIEQVDEGELIDLCRSLLAANPQIVADLQAGKTKAAGALIGQARKQNPNADPNRIREICLAIATSIDSAPS
jgi:aspartyl-tRNA(Asn)/glutamyl-tRNA(Gln) amidotransferase subunit B